MSFENLHQFYSERKSATDAGLVSPRISQQPDEKGILLYPRGVKFQASALPKSQPEPPVRTNITGFSDNSRRRLRFVAVNAFPALNSQFLLTYHNKFPLDGKESKKHLNAFLVGFRRAFPGAPYLWILEFQGRGAAHYHLFTNVPTTEENRLRLASIWCKIVDSDDVDLLNFHSRPQNFISWDMGTGSYVAKYLEKERQKDVPENYKNVGRFWGASRGLVPLPVKVGYEEFSEKYSYIEPQTGEIVDGLITAQRWLGKWYESTYSKRTFQERKEYRKTIARLNEFLPEDQKIKPVKGHKLKRNFRIFAVRKGFTLVTGQDVFCQIESYLSKQRRLSDDFTGKNSEKGGRDGNERYFCSNEFTNTGRFRQDMF
jgi:hypothetical protein